ncbi:MAG TPA: transposase [Methyloceanibacter sp.]|nr:transposase [Methyloceanibacter sp.]
MNILRTNKAATRSEYWRGRIAEQERSGVSVKRFCEEHKVTEQSFYSWRKRLRAEQPMRFALVETGAGRPPQAEADTKLELVLATGERLRIFGGVEAAAIRTVLEALRS